MPDQAERSRLLNKQKADMQALVKKGKTLKGAMKDANAKAIEDLEAQHVAELKAFDEGGSKSGAGKAGGGYNATPAPAAPAPKKDEKKDEKQASAASKRKEFGGPRNWNGYSKTELAEFCADREISKKGGKEELIVRLINFHAELEKDVEREKEDKEKALAAKAEESDSSSGSDSDSSSDSSSEEAKPKKKPKAKAKASSSKAAAADASEDESSDEDSEDEEQLPEVDAEEADKQFKREKAMRGPIKALMTKHPDGFVVDALPELLAGIKVSGFTPQKCGYASLHSFCKAQPPALFKYDKKERKVYPP